MRIAMLGTGPFAVPTFRTLLESGRDVAALVTAPVRFHRGKPVAPVSDIRELAERFGVPVLDPEDINDPRFLSQFAGIGADLLVVCDYGQILSPAALEAARLGGINLHASLLPKYRGAAPINWAIYNGDAETGVTVLYVEPRVDAGPCIAQTRTAIGPDETAPELELRLAEIGAALVQESIDRIAAGDVQPLPQDPSLVTKAPRLKKTDGAIDWRRPAAAIKNQIRAMEPWPKTYTYWHRPDGPPLRVIFGPASVVDDCASAPGTVIEASGDRLLIAAGQGAVAPRAIQPSGKRMMAVDEFLRGHRVRQGERFGAETAL